MKKATVLFYRSDRQMNDALAKYLSENTLTESRTISFFNDEYIYNFMFIGMAEREWDGWMSGIRTCNERGDVVVFSSWDDGESYEEVDDEISDMEREVGYGYDEAFTLFVSNL